jgi:hypothetical protein
MSWQSQSSGISQALNDVAFFDLSLGYVVGNSGTILKTETAGEPPVNLSDHPSKTLDEFQLLGNYPNPFNASTTISWQLARLAGAVGQAPQNNAAGQAVGSRVQLKVYDLLGKEIATLVDERQEAGYHTIMWDGRDDNGNPMASGIYFCIVEAERKREITRLLLMK